MTKLKNIHPGEVLLEEFLAPMAISQNALARAIAVPPRRINEIVLGKRTISADTALRLARFFGTSEQFWMELQADYDLEEARKQLGRKIDAIYLKQVQEGKEVEVTVRGKVIARLVPEAAKSDRAKKSSLNFARPQR